MAMGSTGHILVVGGRSAHLETAESMLDQLERSWSRFIDDSDISRLNRANGQELVVDDATLVLLDRSLRGWMMTNGAFDPTVGAAMAHIGYARSQEFEGSSRHTSSRPAPGCHGIELDRERRTVRMPPGTVFDPGGIGKGLAADMIAEELIGRGARGVLVNIGGDLRAIGAGPDDARWCVGVENPFDSLTQVATFELPCGGGVATSIAEHRRWRVDGRRGRHHIRPLTGQVVMGDISSLTVAADEAWMAEVITKAAIQVGFDAALGVVSGFGHEGIVQSTSGAFRSTFETAWIR